MWNTTYSNIARRPRLQIHAISSILHPHYTRHTSVVSCSHRNHSRIVGIGWTRLHILHSIDLACVLLMVLSVGRSHHHHLLGCGSSFQGDGSVHDECPPSKKRQWQYPYLLKEGQNQRNIKDAPPYSGTATSSGCYSCCCVVVVVVVVVVDETIVATTPLRILRFPYSKFFQYHARILLILAHETNKK
jgi:hypothetical protein